MSERPASYDGSFNDGRSAGTRPVRIRIDTDALVIEAPDGTSLARWPFRDLMRFTDDEAGHLRLGLRRRGDARLVVPDPVFRALLLTQAPHLDRRGGFRATLRLALVLGGVSAALAAGAYFGLPRAAEEIAPLIPASIETRIGDRYHASLIKVWPVCKLDERGEKALEGLTTRLLGRTVPPVPVKVEIIDMKIENAFALPGGHVVATYPLLARMESPDELAGVLAHEFGHVLERHAMISVLQDTGLNVLLQLLTGGSSGSGEWVISSAGTLASLSYSRRLEARADAHGFAMLKQAGISTTGLGNFFERLEKAETDEAGLSLPPFLSDHPPTPERIAQARQAAAANANTKPALSAEDWAALKSACQPKATLPAPDKDGKKPTRKISPQPAG